MASKGEIKNQLERLKIHRGNLAHHMTQFAKAGSAESQAGLTNSIYDERKEIARIKSILRQWHVEVENHPDDDPDLQFTNEPPPIDIAADVAPVLLTTHPRGTRWFWPMLLAMGTLAVIVIGVYLLA